MPDHTDELTAMAQENGMYDVDETTPFRCYPDADGQTNLYKERIQQLYASHARKDVELARLRVEVRAWRCGLLEYDEDPYMDEVLWCAYLSGGWMKFHTIDAAIDALMAEDARNQTETQDNGEQEQGRR